MNARYRQNAAPYTVKSGPSSNAGTFAASALKPQISLTASPST